MDAKRARNLESLFSKSLRYVKVLAEILECELVARFKEGLLFILFRSQGAIGFTNRDFHMKNVCKLG